MGAPSLPEQSQHNRRTIAAQCNATPGQIQIPTAPLSECPHQDPKTSLIPRQVR
jgi:hypothetical protein